MNRVRIKICGITRPDDAMLAATLGADAIGLVFYSRSKRALTAEQAAEICKTLPALVTTVGLFVNPSVQDVESVLSAVNLDCLQFHGDESPGFCRSFHRPYMKAIRVRDGSDVNGLIADHREATAILLDSYNPDLAGGTGETFDWAIAQRCAASWKNRIVLAGGLKADNVARAVAQVRPWALDVSSGVEQEPGRKSPERMNAFFKEVTRVQPSFD